MDRLRALRDSLRPSAVTGGASFGPLLVIFALLLLDEMDKGVFAVVTPEIKDYFGLDITSLSILITLAGVFTILMVVPVGYLADRVKRTRIVAIGSVFLGVCALMSGLAPTLVVFGIARSVIGVSKAAEPAQTSLLADWYPPESRAGVFAFRQLATEVARFIGPLFGGLIVTFFVWQIAFVALAAPAGVLAYIALVRLREPVRGEQERRAMGASEEIALTAERPPSFGESVRVAWNVRTLRRIIYSLPFLVGSVLSISTLISIYYDEVFHVGAGGRGILLALQQPFAVLGLVVGGLMANRFLRERPSQVIAYGGLMAGLGAAAFALVAIAPALWMAAVLTWFIAFALTMLGPATTALLSLVIPARARGLGLSIGAIAIIPGYIFSITAGVLADRYGIRGGILVMTPVLAVGAIILASAATSVASDIRSATAAAMAAQISREAKERGKAKLLVVNDLDVHYGQVQVMFHVDFEVEEGEIVALLGTNGAGKSTLLRAVSGLTAPSNGAIFYDGEDITYLPAHEHAERGIVQVPGGRGVFPSLSVSENLRLASWHLEGEAAPQLDAVYGFFPILRERANEAAGNLSGGEQQMLTLAQAFLSRPRLLMIDELSLGLAPAVVERLLGIVRAIHEQGTTIVLVEQSVNVALTVAERAVFMEKGEVRFTGSTAELMGRPDILRSVYLKGSASVSGGLSGAAAARMIDAGTTDDTVLEVSHISKRFGGISAINDVSFSLQDGRILGLIGPNGAGKTTLFDIISGFVEPDDGAITLFGQDVTFASPDQRSMLGLLRSFQDARLFPALTVAENLAVALERHVEVRSATQAALHLPTVRRSEAKIKRRVERLIEILGLTAQRDKFVRELSTGQRRLVDMACVMAAEPRVLLLDEPSSGIAQREAEELGPLLLRIQRETGCSMLIIEHDMPLIQSVADELIALELGAVITRGVPSEVVEHPDVVASYLGTSDEVINRSHSR